MNWLHALTAGAFGTMALGAMTRVALGHAGRELVAARPIAASYVLVLAAAGVLWSAAFGIFLMVYAPMLVAPRPDGASPR